MRNSISVVPVSVVETAAEYDARMQLESDAFVRECEVADADEHMWVAEREAAYAVCN